MYILNKIKIIVFCLVLSLKINAVPLRIATYNIENFYDRNDDPYSIKDSRVDKGTTPKSARALWALSKVIKKVDADIIALQEVENIGFLREFNKSYLKDLKYKNVVLIEGNSSKTSKGRGIDVAVLSRIPVLAATTYQHRDFVFDDGKKINFSRDFLHVKLKSPDYPVIHLFTLHTISKSSGAWTHYRRIAEAKAGATILEEQFSNDTNSWIVVLGDFNDGEKSKSVKTFLEIPKVPLVRIPLFDKKKKKYTWYGKGTGYSSSTLDHILVSKPLAKKVNAKKSGIFNDKNSENASDHRLLFITLD
ncbi:MAG: endonuclease/exonuclease/phosphatase family protein [Alphaproteobacteria bacterium]